MKLKSQYAAYSEGWDAFFEGKKLKDNPYQDQTEQYLQWELGWEDALSQAERTS